MTLRRSFFARLLAASKTQPSRAELLKHERAAQVRLTEKRGRVENISLRRRS